MVCSVVLQLVATSNESYLNPAYLTLVAVRDPENMLIHIIYLIFFKHLFDQRQRVHALIKYDHMRSYEDHRVQGKSKSKSCKQQ